MSNPATIETTNMVYVFHSIDNFRDLADSVQRRSRVCSRSIFRSATLDFATEEDIGKLVEELNVNTILDLRSEIEAQMSKLGKPFVSFPVATALKMKASDMTDPDPEPSVHEKVDGPTRKTIMINFAGQKFRKYAVWKAAPLKTKMQIVGLIASGQKPKAVKLVGEEIIAKKGLTGLYRDFIDYCDQEICEALQVLSDTSNYPVLVHCTQGKDRTGLVTALALAAAGIEEDKIIEDYSMSQEGLSRVRAHMVKEMEKDGLDPSFADAPPEVMRKTFEYIREKYADVNGYLDYIGFGEKERQGLRKALTFKAMQLEAMSPKAQTRSKQDNESSDGATPRLDRSTKPKTHDRSMSLGSDKSAYDSDSGYSSSGSQPWSPDSREKPLLKRSLGIPIGSRRRKNSGSETPDEGTPIIQSAGAELLGGLGVRVPHVEDEKQHRRSVSEDGPRRHSKHNERKSAEVASDDEKGDAKKEKEDAKKEQEKDQETKEDHKEAKAYAKQKKEEEKEEEEEATKNEDVAPPPRPPKPRGLTVTSPLGRTVTAAE